MINNSNEAAPEPEPEPEPEPPKPVYTNPLTGEVTEEDISGVRPISIMMNNISYAMPMHGNSEADILIEMNAEGNITRMLGIFSQITSKIGKIGSIRSARPYYLDWALGFDMVYISVGGSDTANRSNPEMLLISTAWVIPTFFIVIRTEKPQDMLMNTLCS